MGEGHAHEQLSWALDLGTHMRCWPRQSSTSSRGLTTPWGSTAALAPCPAPHNPRLDLGLNLGTASWPSVPLPPVQVIAAKGLNPSGQLFVAQQLCSHLPPPPPAAPAPGPASVVVAAGPYTPSDDLGYEPLTDLLAYCAGGACALHALQEECPGCAWHAWWPERCRGEKGGRRRRLVGKEGTLLSCAVIASHDCSS